MGDKEVFDDTETEEETPVRGRVFRLRVDEARTSDAGTWRCEISNSVGKVSTACTVKVLANLESKEKPPEFVSFLKNIQTREENMAIFQCKVSGKPTPTVKWFRNGVEIAADDRHAISDLRGLLTLEIKEVGEDDVGVYKVHASNGCGRAFCDAKLTVKRLPECLRTKKLEYNLTEVVRKKREEENDVYNEADLLTSGLCNNDTIRKFLIKWKDDQTLGFPIHLTNKCAVEGSKVILNCLVNGTPPFLVRWFKDNSEIFDGGRYFVKNRSGMLTLEIPCVRTEDTGNYMCEVRTTQGKVYTSCYLQAEPVLETPVVEFQKPLFTKPMKRQTVNKGELIRFRVTAKGSPPPGFKWFKDGQEIHDNHRISTEVTTYGVAQLAIEMAETRDIGLYTCEVHNVAGRARSMVRLSVRDEYVPMEFPAIRSSPDDKVNRLTLKDSSNGFDIEGPEHTPQQFSEVIQRDSVFTLQLPSRQNIRHMGRLLLECCVNGLPKPKVSWFRDGTVLEQSDRVSFLQLGDWYGLEILDTLDSDAGQYTVRADFGQGSVESKCHVEMTMPTESPKDVSLPLETPETIMRKDQVAMQTITPIEKFQLPQITPSVHLCNTEPNCSETVEEVKLKDMCETPHFTQPLPDQLLPLDTEDAISMECHAGGFPCPLVAWFKDDAPLTSSDKVTIAWDSESRIARVQLLQMTSMDTGRYTCVAYSSSGHAVTSTVLHIRHATEDEASKENTEGKEGTLLPVFKIKLTDKEVPAGSLVKLECVVNGSQNVKWYKNDTPIEATNDKYTIKNNVEGFHSLKIAGVQQPDADCYKCEATNDVGMVTSSAILSVHEVSDTHEDELSRPTFLEPLHSVIATAGHDAVFKCVANGNPVPKFKWFAHAQRSSKCLYYGMSMTPKKTGLRLDWGKPVATHFQKTNLISTVRQRDVMDVQKSDRFKVTVNGGETTLTITNVTVQDSGLYFCNAQNKLGRVKTLATLKIIGADTGDRRNTWSGDLDAKEEEALIEIRAKYGSLDDSADSKRVTLFEDEGFETSAGPSVSSTTKKKETVEEITSKDAKSEEKPEVPKPAQDETDQQQAKEETPEKGLGEEAKVETVPEAADKGKEKEQNLNKDDVVNVSKPDEEVNQDGGKEGADVEGKKETLVTQSEPAETTDQSQTASTPSHEKSPGTTEVKVSSQAAGTGPRFLKKPLSQWVAEKGPLDICVTAVSAPDLEVVWYKDGCPIKDVRYQQLYR